MYQIVTVTISLALVHLTIQSVLIQPASSSSLEREKRRTLVDCGPNHHEAPGKLKSPNYPNLYPGETECQWIISTTKGKIISVKFLDFDFENHDSCDYDYLEIYDGDSRNARKLGRFCGGKIPRKYTSSGSKLFVIFHSDPAAENRGFEMEYSTSYGCDKVLTEDSGKIVSPNYPGRYPQPTQCNYNIIGTSGKTIRLTFEEFKLEESVGGCEYDYVEIFDGPTALFPSLGKFCGETLPSVKPSSKNKILIRFVSDTTVNKRGFRMKYYAKETPLKEICSRPSYTGDCRADIVRWFYNIKTQKCEKFSFGGCNPNGNNFKTKRKCQRGCKDIKTISSFSKF